jgi:hypothetical protein
MAVSEVFSFGSTITELAEFYSSVKVGKGIKLDILHYLRLLQSHLEQLQGCINAFPETESQLEAQLDSHQILSRFKLLQEQLRRDKKTLVWSTNFRLTLRKMIPYFSIIIRSNEDVLRPISYLHRDLAEISLHLLKMSAELVTRNLHLLNMSIELLTRRNLTLGK